jgi:predicted AlkP superfamily pyrophosphatase or phosphodiesterase
MKQTVVINVVGLTSKILEDTSLFISQWSTKGKHIATIEPVLPAVTCSAQTTYLTGTLPSEHGIVGNGWYNKEQSEVQFWKQSNKLVQAPYVWDEARKIDPNFTCANMFWWYNMYSTVDYSVTPRPQYWANGLKKPDCYSFPSELRDELQNKFGTFPLFDFWGPRTTIKSSRWIADASKYVFEKHKPTLQLIYIPHLDYCFQKYDASSKEVQQDIKDLDALLKDLIEFYERYDVTPILLSEYGISPVSQPIHLNRIFRKNQWLKLRMENGRELLDAGASKVFAVADHQVAHIYCEASLKEEVKNVLQQTNGVESVLDEMQQKEQGIWHERSGDLVVTSKAGAWFTYYYWLHDQKAPDFARTVDIHKKPGYDPVEMFLNNQVGIKFKVIWKLLLKKLGFRVLFDVISLDATRIKGSHGRTQVQDNEKPVLIAVTNNKKHLKATEIKELLLSSVFEKEKNINN